MSRRTIRCGAAAAMLPLATLAQVAPPPNPGPAQLNPVQPAPAADQLPKLKWVEICGLGFIDNRLVLRCTLSLETLRKLTSDEREVDGIPGIVTCDISFRKYRVENTRRRGNEEIVYRVGASRIQLSLEVHHEVGGKESGVQFTQGSYETSRRSVRGSDCRLTAFGPNVPGESISVEASDLTTLKRNYPHEVNRYLRPLLRDLGWDLFQVDAAVARQVLFSLEEESEADPATRPTTGPATTSPATRSAAVKVDPKLVEEVRQLLAEADSKEFARREAAMQKLARLGPPAVAAFDQIDREHLSSQQNLTMDLLESLVAPVSAEEARRLRGDLHFLTDCLYHPDADIRTAAADRIVRLGKAKADRLQQVVAVDPVKDPDGAVAAIEKLREEIVPPNR